MKFKHSLCNYVGMFQHRFEPKVLEFYDSRTGVSYKSWCWVCTECGLTKMIKNVPVKEIDYEKTIQN